MHPDEYIFFTGVVHKGVIYKENDRVPVAVMNDTALKPYIRKLEKEITPSTSASVVKVKKKKKKR